MCAAPRRDLSVCLILIHVGCQKLSPQLRTLTAGLVHGQWLARVACLGGGACCPASALLGAFGAELSPHLACLTFAPGECVPAGHSTALHVHVSIPGAAVRVPCRQQPPALYVVQSDEGAIRRKDERSGRSSWLTR